MHEMSLAEGVLQQVEETAQREAAHRVKRIVLEIGRLAAVEAEALKFCFEAVALGTIAQAAVLEIIEIAGVGRCLACAASVPMDELYGLCPDCGSPRLQATGGDEMRLREIEIE